MLSVHRPSLYQNSLTNDISLMSIQEDQHKPSKRRKIQPQTADQDSYTHDVFMDTRSATPQHFYPNEIVTHSLKR